MSFVKGILCLCVAAVALTGVMAQAATVAYYTFDEKDPGNTADIMPITGALIDVSGNGHNGDIYGGVYVPDEPEDPDYGTGMRPIYVAGPVAGDSAIQFTLQDFTGSWADLPSEDLVKVPAVGDFFTIDYSHDNVYTIEAIVRAPDPTTIMNRTLYEDVTNQFEYTNNGITGMRNTTTSAPGRFVVSLGIEGHVSVELKDQNGLHYADGCSNTSVTGGLWHNVAVKVYGSTVAANRKLEFYVDNQLDGTLSLSTFSGVVGTGTGWSLASANGSGGEWWGNQFVGDIDAIRFSTGEVTFLPTVPTQVIPDPSVTHVGMTDPDTEAGIALRDYGGRLSTWTPTPGAGGDPDSGLFHEDAVSTAYYHSLMARETLDKATLLAKGTPVGKNAPGWTMTATLKLVSSNKPWNQAIAVDDETNSWVMSFMDSNYTEESGNDPGAAGAGVYKTGAFDNGTSENDAHFTGVAKLGVTDPTDGFHKYQMSYNAATDSVTFIVDDVVVGTQARAETWARPGGLDWYESKNRTWFGDSFPMASWSRMAYGGVAEGYWGDVTLETGYVPEPSTFVLLAMGALALLLRRRGR